MFGKLLLIVYFLVVLKFLIFFLSDRDYNNIIEMIFTLIGAVILAVIAPIIVIPCFLLYCLCCFLSTDTSN